MQTAGSESPGGRRPESGSNGGIGTHTTYSLCAVYGKAYDSPPAVVTAWSQSQRHLVLPDVTAAIRRTRKCGGELSERLREVFPLQRSFPDVSTVYRALADLEAQGAVRSELTPGGGGGRKVYELTDVGWDLFAFWEAQFKEEQSGLVRLLQHFERTRCRRPGGQVR